MHIDEKGDNSLNILMYTYANHQMGMGHIYRMSTLGSFLKKREHDIQFFIPDWKEGVTKIFQDGWPQISIPVNQFENEIHYKNKLQNLRFDCIIVDALNVSEQIMKLFREKTNLLISFDNNGDGRFFSDILINILYKRLPPLHAPKLEINDYSYIIISDEFGDIHQKEKVIPKTVQKILITQGGSDTYGVVPQLIDVIETTKTDIEFFIFIGPAFKHHKELALSVKKSALKIHVIKNIKNPWDLFYDMDLAISGGGMTLFELLCLGIPTITTTQEIKELETIDDLTKNNLILNLGYFDKTKKEQISSLISDIDRDYEKRLKLSTNSKKYMDGNGCERIADLIEKYYSKVKVP